MTRFYTRTGDEGYTGLLGDSRAPKYDPRIETLGAIDEANAALGLARSICLATRTSPILIAAQKDLYHIMTEVAVQPENRTQFHRFSADRVAWLESQIEIVSAEVNTPDEFIIPGDSHPGAALDLGRTIIRRAERGIARLLHQDVVDNPELLRYLNRLSSLCFALELLENQAAGHSTPTLAKE